ncbi:MAG TPA: type II toxin-antitoxin system antitoxin SocA domain-containing protein [Rhizomicrobium sp.]
MPYDARHIANYLLDEADRIELPLTQVSLQKTIFYSHGWQLVLADRPLISDDVEAWTYGPVIRSLRENFRMFGRQRILKKRAYFYNPISDETSYRPYEISTDDQKFLNQMLSFYGKMDPFVLVRMTHRKGSPWDRVMASNQRANLGRVIPNSEIKVHFERLLQNRPQNRRGGLPKEHHL